MLFSRSITVGVADHPRQALCSGNEAANMRIMELWLFEVGAARQNENRFQFGALRGWIGTLSILGTDLNLHPAMPRTSLDKLPRKMCGWQAI